jgi:spore coat polysaccharide biosynthesis protein SpsF
MGMNVVIIIQARMGSTRLPGKMLLEIDSKSIIAYVVDRVRQSSLINTVLLATGKDKSNDVLADWAGYVGIPCYRGSENDVLDRIYQAAKQVQADVVVRITGDCPLMDFEIIDAVVAEYHNGKYDYVSNVHPPTYPDGMDVEVFSFASLEKAWNEATLASEREHVTPYIWKNTDLFHIKNVASSEDLSQYRLTLDTQEDFILLQKIITYLNKKEEYCGLSCIVDTIKKHPEWMELNVAYDRNEGYEKSLKEEN